MVGRQRIQVPTLFTWTVDLTAFSGHFDVLALDDEKAADALDTILNWRSRVIVFPEALEC